MFSVRKIQLRTAPTQTAKGTMNPVIARARFHPCSLMITRKLARQGTNSVITTRLTRSSRSPLVSRTQIAEHVWNYDFDNLSNLIDVHIFALRRKLDDQHAVKLLHTVRGVGYRLGISEN